MNNIELSSIQTRAEKLQRITIESNEEFVLVIKKEGTLTTICEAVINVQELEYQFNSGKSGLSLNVVNLDPIPQYATRVTYINDL